MFARIKLVVPEDKHKVVYDLCEQVVKECVACREKDRPGQAPKVGGLIGVGS